MEALFTSTAVVALAEIGDKTMLLAMLLAARFRQPVSIAFGILFATIANHFLAALLGVQAAAWFDSDLFRYLVAAGFVVMGLWTLIPDKFEEDDQPKSRGGAFLTTLIAFFIVEIGDKTQIATVALGARFADTLMVTTGTTIGMMLANAPVLWLGDKLADRLPLAKIRMAAALLFVVLGLWLVAETAGLLG
ncbi:TMEM165/GDT1 family protein [Croceicoccus naphthovorans]|uniref:GDT1 family protein n=1 Tax=Croceicoccus naphthovorans TaxID=1348774 RepID=A0A0G3XG32_9SPHN|nr:TMEM165/GDT1 family protein [Croceicoccus naphthovorans]AKM09353.1 membrane protein [Croceicoccus naphthovorans]